MSLPRFIKSFFNPSPVIDEHIQQRLERWKALPEPDLAQPFTNIKFIILDVETSGFSLRKDQLIAIGACQLINGKIPLSQTLDVILRQEQSSSKKNILIHRISRQAQLNGIDPAEALMQFLEFIGKQPLVAFYVGFDKPMLNKALKKYLGIDLNNRTWLDIAFVAPLFFPEHARQHRNLDYWMNLFAIQNSNRHKAISDAIATAQVMQVIMKSAPENLKITELKRMEAKAMRIHQELHGQK
ncbi:exonuclease [Pelistega indica]|uniref:Exonuclease n=1 Tax=Pelistega indica TaxID=1414851 RepID=V8G6X5_9BURK|nr:MULTISPECIES: 3'-5' exonuclease [Pelistega]ETD72289.1 exonuclease [Pelistega indica]